MMTQKKIRIIVTDASTMITLAVANALDALILPTGSVVIPDIVRYEVIREMMKPGAREIAEWIRKNEPDRVRIASTEVFEACLSG